jgi:phosphatidylserine/phosphatidylglycerophosphate/cardiolipin synthase-like enzyme
MCDIRQSGEENEMNRREALEKSIAERYGREARGKRRHHNKLHLFRKTLGIVGRGFSRDYRDACLVGLQPLKLVEATGIKEKLSVRRRPGI